MCIKKAKQKIIILLDCLGLFSWIKLIVLSNKLDIAEILYYSDTKIIKILHQLPGFKRIFFPRYKQLRYELGSIFSSSGENIYWQWYSDTSQLGIDITNSRLIKDQFPMIDLIGQGYNKKKIFIFLAQEIAKDLGEALRLVLIISDRQNKTPEQKLLLLVKDTPWQTSLKGYARKKNVEVDSYCSLQELQNLPLVIFKFFCELIINTFASLIYISKSMRQSCGPMIAVPYLNGIDFGKRNDLFWFPQSGISADNILVYFKNTVQPLTAEIESKLKESGLSYANLLFKSNLLKGINGKINVFPSFYFVKKLIISFFATAILIPQLFIRFTKERCWKFNKVSLLWNKVIFYESLFKKNNIKIHFSLLCGGADLTALNIAIELMQGVDISTHYSNVPALHVFSSVAHDIYFSWGPYYKRIFETVPNLESYFIYYGYLYDSFFNNGKKKAELLRKGLEGAGADFILTFFDEQYSYDDWFTKAALEDIYSDLLSLVLQDDRFALIIKPKKRCVFLSEKRSRVYQLLQNALNTERCILLDGWVLPNDAAQASDLVIGMGVFNTAVLESALCKVPFFTFDPGRMTSYPYYKFGFNKIVFNDLDPLISAIKTFRVNPDKSFYISCSEYLEMLSKIDPYRDGKSSERIGYFMKSLFDELKRGSATELAISFAIKNYQSRWGIDKVEKLNELTGMKSA